MSIEPLETKCSLIYNREKENDKMENMKGIRPMLPVRCEKCGSLETFPVRKRVGIEKLTYILIPVFAVIFAILGLCVFFLLMDWAVETGEGDLIWAVVWFMLSAPVGGGVLGGLSGKGIVRLHRRCKGLSNTAYCCKRCRKNFVPSKRRD